MMKTHHMYMFNEHGEPAIKVRTRKWNTHILVSLTKTQVDEVWFHTITWAYYFWLGPVKWTRLVKTTTEFSPWNSKSWEENERKRARWTSEHLKPLETEENLRETQTWRAVFTWEQGSKETEFLKAVTAFRGLSAPHLFPRCLCQRWSSRWATGTVLMSVMVGSTKPNGIWVFRKIHPWAHMWPTEAADSGAVK